MSTIISKTTYTFTVLHRTDEPLESMGEALHRASEGNAVGAVTGEHTVEVPSDSVADELLELGNDGEFFDGDLWGES